MPLNTYSWEKGGKPPIGKNLFLSRFLAWLRGEKRKEKKKVFLRDEPVSRNIKRYWGIGVPQFIFVSGWSSFPSSAS